MTSSTLKLSYGKYYHIYNRGINSCNLFIEAVSCGSLLKAGENTMRNIGCLPDSLFVPVGTKCW